MEEVQADAQAYNMTPGRMNGEEGLVIKDLFKNSMNEEHKIRQYEFLVGESLLLGLMGELLFTYPDERRLLALVEQNPFSEEVPFAAQQPEVLKGISLLVGWMHEYAEMSSTQAFDLVRSDFTRLFIGPGEALVPPWESVYFAEERLTFQERTLQVRSWYMQFGLQAVNFNKEPDDHIGLELTFVAHLANKAATALDKNQSENFTRLIQSQKRFLCDHLLRWGPQWCNRLQEIARTDFLRGIGSLTLGTLTELSEVFNLENVKVAPYL